MCPENFSSLCNGNICPCEAVWNCFCVCSKSEHLRTTILFALAEQSHPKIAASELMNCPRECSSVECVAVNLAEFFLVWQPWFLLLLWISLLLKSCRRHNPLWSWVYDRLSLLFSAWLLIAISLVTFYSWVGTYVIKEWSETGRVFIRFPPRTSEFPSINGDIWWAIVRERKSSWALLTYEIFSSIIFSFKHHPM